MTGVLSRSVAIAGIGATEFSKRSGRSELRLAVEAVLAAVADAGLEPSDVDGMVTYTAESSSDIHVARNAGIGELTYFSRVGYGGGAACGTVAHAAAAIAAGLASVVVCWRAFNERSGERYGLGQADRPVDLSADRAAYSWMTPFGLNTPAQWVAMFARRYMHDFGATSEDFGRVAVLDRKHAATNPRAWFHQRPITLAEHQESRWIAEPLHLLDCCQETDGGQALVLVSAERARDLPHLPVEVLAAAQGSGADQHMMTSYYRPSISGIPEMGLVGEQLWAQSGLRPGDVQAAILYDHFTPLVLPQLEELGFCARGEAKDFIRDGQLELDGLLPANTHGGQLGEAYLHGMNGIAEAVRLVRGTSVNQPPDVRNVVVTAGTGVPTSGLILGASE
ncbi:Acetyl-CoA acetyltransferase [Saccharopolyspora kobensis]|uniref:Acetyl-CoA acetyltransferase n=1 Tax=Saccharopolyspora kobensis TaxID=146035 RepID=A0A1H5VZB5_9PSEU|nr:lipid-transfer protein [Saccharopolyspora kobensis]SEF92316.1 Acetyl-CoA acetyltransferase [Saccharopolyspora kobensis]SFC55313.1 Acetyl-CoA acetyltransferase [Saccharopolyspora kobensis]